MSKHSEEDIIKGCKKADPYFQEILYNTQYEPFYRVCLRYVKSYEDAEQLTNDGFIKVFNNIDKYSGKGSFNGWMRRIMVNTCLDHLKSKFKKEQSQTISADSVETHAFFTINTNVIDDIAYQDLIKMVHELSPTTQAVFNMFVIEGYSHREISQELGMSEGTSQWHVNNARKILQEKIIKLNERRDEK